MINYFKMNLVLVKKQKEKQGFEVKALQTAC